MSNTLLLCALIGQVTPAASDELRSGDWRVEYSDNGVSGVWYEQTRMLGVLSVTHYTDDYKASHWGLQDAQVTRDGDTLRFSKIVEGKGTCEATLEIEGDTLRWTVDVAMEALGHLECHVPIAQALAETPSGDLYFRTDGLPHELIDTQRFEPIYPRESVRLNTLQHDLNMALEGPWVLQDRRDGAWPALRVIGQRRSTGEGVTEARLGITITVERGTPEEQRERRLLLGQRRATVTELDVENGGFEGGLGGWAHGPNARAVEGGAGGGTCARIDVERSDEPNVYLTRQVPVTPGARYRVSGKVRTENVEADHAMRMASVGAVIIHEWADPEGEWIYAGSYSKGHWGTGAGWQPTECNELLAPQGVGYAIIFLGLRGRGTAWFDDVKLVEVKRHTVITSPLAGATLVDNRPMFQWRPEPTASRYTVTCTGFEQEYNWTTTGASFRPSEKLPPGTYTWQATADGAHPSVTWSFTQTAPADADTTGPEVTVAPVNLERGKGWLELTAQDESGVEAQGISMRIDGAPTACRVREAGGGLQVRPKGNWPRGGLRVDLAVPDGADNVTIAETWVVTSPPPPRSLTWTYDGGVFDGEQHALTMAMYQVPPEQMAKIKQAGFDTVHMYTFEGSKNDAGAREYLDACQRHDLRAFIGFDRGNHTGSGLVQGNLDHVAKRIGALRDHPALLAWYLFDEPDLGHQYVPPDRLRALYEFIKALDPHHPVIVTFANDNAVARYPTAYDVHWTQVYGGTDYVRSRIETHRPALGETPLQAILTCYDRRQSAAMKAGEAPDEAAFAHKPEKLRADVWMALALRSSGLAWWWMGDGGKQWLTAADVPTAWEALTDAISEVREVEPLLTEEGDELRVELTTEPEDANVAARARRVGDTALVIVVSAETERSVRYSLQARRMPDANTARLMWEGREVEVVDGTIEGELAPWGRHVYEVELR